MWHLTPFSAHSGCAIKGHEWTWRTINSKSVIKPASLSSATHLPCKLGQVSERPQNKMKLTQSEVSRPHTTLYFFLKAAATTNYPQLDDLNRSLFSPNSRGQKLKIQMSAHLAVPGGSEGDSFPSCLLNAGGCQHPLGVPWLVVTSLQCLPPSSHSPLSPACLCVSNPYSFLF